MKAHPNATLPELCELIEKETKIKSAPSMMQRELVRLKLPRKKSLYAFQVARCNARTRLIAVRNGLTGKVTYLQRSKIGVLALQEFYQRVRAEYLHAKTIYVVQDNWPVHKLPQVFQSLQDQALTPLFLPTYASWLSPIEKLWRWLKQDILHLHLLANNLEVLRTQGRDFLDRFTSGSDPLVEALRGSKAYSASRQYL